MTKPLADTKLILDRLNDLISRMEGPVSSPWFTSAQTAQYLHCSRRKIEDLTRRGLLPFSRQDPTSPKSPRLYHRRHLDAYLITGKNLLSRRLSLEEKRLVKQLAL